MTIVKKRRALIAAGGTGGHFYPGLALGRELARRGWQVLFLVKEGDISAAALDAEGLPYAEIPAAALPRSLNPLRHARFLVKFFSGLRRTSRILADYSPDAVFGAGSYVSFPAVLLAALRGVPRVVHESNAVFGLGNRIAGAFCPAVALGLPLEKNPFAGKTVMTGTPVREFIPSAVSREEARALLGLKASPPVVAAFGGSQGASALNSALAAAAGSLRAEGAAFQILHVAGKGNGESTRLAYAAAGLGGDPGIKVLDYCAEMDLLYAAADILVSRAGASTVAELAAVRKPAILVPLPTSAGGHQAANAAVLARAGAAVSLPQDAGLAEAMAAELSRLLGGKEAAAAMSAAYDIAGIPDPLKAASALADLMEGKNYRG
ncbi:MAG: UDP-N-acetylglucosamine--N-acetylmuramyl-(pentapeptide) pyrophosphoryl-undecaprenol [Elusimicrobia bacterium]|nr:MAG: UDP-N-acetylglucosamine--N-acetylmuramyl-(pentapeptide) pyrophosphoryl-undecaprenol N-acetylglucosamine transferase [Elusimicrobiota bacterium]KAF0155873.1 MAG: UDP-N-acetylglucosamine--N-acetylmuramyl-(pentapeptide) pyrophosphoryl-undecaprenol [Elusimicrobiota bacterium]